MSVQMVQVGITTRCNSDCYFCFREELKRAGRKEGPADMPLSTFKKILENEDLRDVQLCCNRGEAIFHPEIDVFINMIKEHGYRFEMNTNGDRFEPNWWYDLGKKMTRGDQIIFALDGLKTTHEYYRKTRWSKVFKNMKAFIDGGGHAIWQMILYKHNEHQVKMIKNLSKSVGCTETWIINSRQYNEKYQKPVGKFGKTKEDILLENIPSKINCRFFYGERVYIGVDGQVWPCCFTRCHFGFKERAYAGNPVTEAVKEQIDYINAANTPLNEIVEKSKLFKTVFGHMNDSSIPFIETIDLVHPDKPVMYRNPKEGCLARHPRLMVNFACQLYCGGNIELDTKNRRRTKN